MPDELLTTRALSRATLARQHLLVRSTITPLAMVEHLVGLQAQIPHDPYTALWSRLDRFSPESLGDLLLARQVVRLVLMRGTIHLVTANDALRLRPLMQPVLDAELRRHRDYAPALEGVPLGPVLDFAAARMAKQPLTGPELRAALADGFPGRDSAALAYACRCLLPIVQVPPRGVWGTTSRVTVTTAEAWLGRPLPRRPSIDEVVLRYLGAFGPASVADVGTWCRLTGLRDVVDRLRPRLRTFRDARGRELFDLPEAPRPDPETPAPPRFLPEYDNVVLSHDDRTRIVPEHRRAPLARAGGVGHGRVLHDGFVCAMWRLRRDDARSTATLDVTLAERLPKRAVASIEAEGRRYLRFAVPAAERREVLVVSA